MTRHPLALQRRALPPEDYEFDDSAPPSPAPAAARAFLIGMREAYGMPALQSMRVIMVMPGQRTHAPAARERVALEPLHGASAPHALRAIGGDVLRDTQGRLFERRADHTLRALGPVFAGARGELYERADVSDEVEDVEPRDGDATEAVVNDTPRSPPMPRRARTLVARERPSHRAVAAANASANAATEAAPPTAVRALLPAAGKWVQVRVGEFAALLQGQLAQPDRIAADYEIGAWLQVFEADTELEPAAAAQRIFGDERMAARLAPWTAAIAQRLGVTLGAHNAERSRSRSRAAPGCIATGRRFFSLTVAADPTLRAEPMVLPADAVLRTTVPPALQAALPPCLPREQAIAQLQYAQSPGWWQRWRRRVSAATRVRWQQQLAGRSLDEQLWAVPPPPHGLGDAGVREWVARTLRLAGYDAARMADEWQIFWRCRGASD